MLVSCSSLLSLPCLFGVDVIGRDVVCSPNVFMPVALVAIDGDAKLQLM